MVGSHLVLVTLIQVVHNEYRARQIESVTLNTIIFSVPPHLGGPM